MREGSVFPSHEGRCPGTTMKKTRRSGSTAAQGRVEEEKSGLPESVSAAKLREGLSGIWQRHRSPVDERFSAAA